MVLTHSPIFAWRRLVQLGVLLMLTDPVFTAEDGCSLVDAQGNEINVEVMPGQGEVLAVWFVDHGEMRLQFEKMLRAINASGVAAVIDSAHARSRPDVPAVEAVQLSQFVHSESARACSLFGKPRYRLEHIGGLGRNRYLTS